MPEVCIWWEGGFLQLCCIARLYIILLYNMQSELKSNGVVNCMRLVENSHNWMDNFINNNNNAFMSLKDINNVIIQQVCLTIKFRNLREMICQLLQSIRVRRIANFCRSNFRSIQMISGDNVATYKSVVICGPSGVGKGTIISYLINMYPTKFGLSVSHTTRSPRFIY